jgi:uncharacterized membrane protein YfcA
LLPISIGVATIAMASGIGGAVFFTPIFLLWLRLEPTVAVGIALTTELFGFSSGLYAYFRAQLIDFKLGANLLMFSIPGAIAGVVFADAFPPIVLKSVFASGLIFIGIQLFTSWRDERRQQLDHEIEQEGAQDSGNTHESSLTDRTGRKYFYTICNKNMGRGFAAVGGAFLGMISVGLAELQEYHLVAKCRVPSAVAVGTSIFVVVITVSVAVVGHLIDFVSAAETEVFNQIVNVVIFTVPGVLIGGQIGPRLQARLDPDKLKVAISFMFVVVGAFMLWTLIP